MDDVVLTMAPMAVRLKGVVTEAERRGTLNRLSMIAPGFYQRFQRGFGVFFLADSIGKLNPNFTSDLFRRTPGFGVYDDAVVFSTRPAGDLRGGLCFPDLYIDGTHVGPGEVNLVAPTDVLAIEAYQAGQPAPVQFPGHACGEIIIWTK